MTLPIYPPTSILQSELVREGAAAVARLAFEQGQDYVYQAADNRVTMLLTAQSVPVNTALPAVTPTTGIVAGTTVFSCTTGSWSGNPTTYTYQWKRDAANVGTNSSSYSTVAGDSTHSISCVVTASNTQGTTPATSNSVAVP